MSNVQTRNENPNTKTVLFQLSNVVRITLLWVSVNQKKAYVRTRVLVSYIRVQQYSSTLLIMSCVVVSLLCRLPTFHLSANHMCSIIRSLGHLPPRTSRRSDYLFGRSDVLISDCCTQKTSTRSSHIRRAFALRFPVPKWNVVIS